MPAARRRRNWVGTSDTCGRSFSANTVTVSVSKVACTGSLSVTKALIMTCRPEMCPAGSTHSHVWPGRAPIRSTEARAEACKAEADSSTPFGEPVEPEVVTTSAVSSRAGTPLSRVATPSGLSTDVGRIAASSSATRVSGVPAGIGIRAGP